MAFGEPFVMKSASLGLWIAVSSATLGAAGVSASSPPQSLDSRLVFERIAAEPEIVTLTGIAVDQRGRILVVESHTHFRPAGYQGPPADRIRVFEDRDRDGKTECTGTFFEGTQKTMNVAVARDGSVFVATRSALYRLEDRDGDGRSDNTTEGKLPAPIVRLDTKGDYPHNGLSGFAFDFAGTVYFGLGENLGADYRLIGKDGTTLSGGGEGGNILKTIAGSDASPLVRSDAMRRLADPAAKDVLLKALESEDPFVQQAARKGLQRSLKIDELIALAATKDLAAGRRLGLLLILRDSSRPEASALLPGFLTDPDLLIHFIFHRENHATHSA
jgi:hypothetical protein